MGCRKVVIAFGNLTYLALLIAQCLLLASYPAKYQNNSSWYAFLLFIAPAFAISWWRIYSDERKDAQLVHVWFAYVYLGLVPMIGIVFALTAEELDKSKQFGPDELKLSLCITPLILLLLLSAGVDTITREKIILVSFKMFIDLLDGNELLQIVIDGNIENFGIPRSFMKALISFACITFLLSPLEMAAHLLVTDEDKRQGAVGIYGFFQVLHNITLFGLRLGIWLGEGWNFSMLIVKNVFMIFVRGLEFSYIFRREENAEQENNVRTGSAPGQI